MWIELKKADFHKDLNDLLCKTVCYNEYRHYTKETMYRYKNTAVPLEYIESFFQDYYLHLLVFDGVKAGSERYLVITGISIDTVSINDTSYKFVCFYYKQFFFFHKIYIDVFLPISATNIITNDILIRYFNEKKVPNDDHFDFDLNSVKNWNNTSSNFYSYWCMNKYQHLCIYKYQHWDRYFDPHLYFFGSESRMYDGFIRWWWGFWILFSTKKIII